MLQPARLHSALEALRAAAEASRKEHDPKLRAALIEARVEELLAEVASAVESENLPHYASMVLRVFEEIGLPKEQKALMGQAVLGLGKTYERLGDNANAYDAYTRALSLAREMNDDALIAGCLRRMGRVMMRMTRWEEASAHFRESYEIYQRIDDRRGSAETLCDIGSLHYHQGDLAQAEARYNEALEMAEELNHTSLIINLTNNMGIIANVRGDLESAIAHYQRCIPLAEQAQREPMVAQAYHNLGMAYADRGEWRTAGDYYERALHLARKHSIVTILGTLHLNKAEMYLEFCDIDMAAVSCGRALNIFRSSQNRLGEAEAYRVLGSIFALRHDEITSAEMFNQSLTITKEAGAPLEIAETYRAMGLGYERLGHTDEAIKALEEARKYFDQVQALSDLQATEKDLARLRGHGEGR